MAKLALHHPTKWFILLCLNHRCVRCVFSSITSTAADSQWGYFFVLHKKKIRPATPRVEKQLYRARVIGLPPFFISILVSGLGCTWLTDAVAYIVLDLNVFTLCRDMLCANIIFNGWKTSSSIHNLIQGGGLISFRLYSMATLNIPKVFNV